MADNKKQKNGRGLSTPVKIVIIIFAIIFALSLLLPFMSSFMNSSAQRQAAQQEAEEVETGESTSAEGGDEASEDQASESEDTAEGEDADASEDAAKEDAVDTSDVPENDSLKSYAETYKPRVARYEKRLESDPENLAALLNLGQTYMNWGYMADYVAMETAEHDYANGLIDKAIEYFDKYLKLHESKSVRVDRALCKYYKDDVDGAMQDIQALCDENPDYALAWANLGMLYESKGDDEGANEAYKKAAELDPDDETGAKSFANERLIAINSTVSSLSDAAGDASASNLGSSEADTNSGLTNTLKQDTGLGF